MNHSLSVVVVATLQLICTVQCFDLRPQWSKSLWGSRTPVAASAFDSPVVARPTDWDQVEQPLQDQAVKLAATLVRQRLGEMEESNESFNNTFNIVQDQFVDLACTYEGEQALERLFSSFDIYDPLLASTVHVMQSLCVYGLGLGVTGVQDQMASRRIFVEVDCDSPRAVVRRRKQQQDGEAGKLLLAELKLKRTATGAFRLLNRLGVWSKHENLYLLRSGIPLRFLREEISAAAVAVASVADPDEILGLRRDLTHLKVFAIDPDDAQEIDDGLSIEKLQDGRTRIWIHIADADHWAPRNSSLFQLARQRITSIYLPNQTCSMFPRDVADKMMSLALGKDSRALSAGLVLNCDGSIDESSILLTPSTIRLTYKLTYEDADEMLEEGVAFAEEWELGELHNMAERRRKFRVEKGCFEGKMEKKIPVGYITLTEDETQADNIRMCLSKDISDFDPAAGGSLSRLLVSESMILAGEVLGRWKTHVEKKEDPVAGDAYVNRLRVPFRSQTIDYNSRPQWHQTMKDLLEYNVGDGLCHSWFIRRFLEPVALTESAAPHNGLGLECYVQWTSPIRRFGDLQAHTLVKRFLRREEVFRLLSSNNTIPLALDLQGHLGLPANVSEISPHCCYLPVTSFDADIDINEGGGVWGVTRRIQRQTQRYWMLQYILRELESDPDKVYSALVLGKSNPRSNQYDVYIDELGLETRYTASSEGGFDPGDHLSVKFKNIRPVAGSLQLVRSM